MNEKEIKYATRINDCLERINKKSVGSNIPPQLIRELQLACFDFSNTIPVSSDTANFAMELMHNAYCLSKKDDYDYMDNLESILYLNLEFNNRINESNQITLMNRIQENFDIIINTSEAYLDTKVTSQYKRDISELCEKCPNAKTMNFAMDLMNKLCDEIRKNNGVHLICLQNYTYECFRFFK